MNDIHSFTEKQDEINKSYNNASLARISQNLEYLISDLERSNTDLALQSNENEKMYLINNILNGNQDYKWKIDSIRHETEIARMFINSDLYYEIINTVKNVEYLTDPDHFHDDDIKIIAWLEYCKRAIQQGNSLLSKVRNYSGNA